MMNRRSPLARPETVGPVPNFARRLFCVLPLHQTTQTVRARRIAFLRGVRTCLVRRESLISACVLACT